MSRKVGIFKIFNSAHSICTSLSISIQCHAINDMKFVINIISNVKLFKTENTKSPKYKQFSPNVIGSNSHFRMLFVCIRIFVALICTVQIIFKFYHCEKFHHPNASKSGVLNSMPPIYLPAPFYHWPYNLKVLIESVELYFQHKLCKPVIFDVIQLPR